MKDPLVSEVTGKCEAIKSKEPKLNLAQSSSLMARVKIVQDNVGKIASEPNKLPCVALSVILTAAEYLLDFQCQDATPSHVFLFKIQEQHFQHVNKLLRTSLKAFMISLGISPEDADFQDKGDAQADLQTWKDLVCGAHNRTDLGTLMEEVNLNEDNRDEFKTRLGQAQNQGSVHNLWDTGSVERSLLRYGQNHSLRT